MAQVDLTGTAYQLEELHFKIDAVRAELIDGDEPDDGLAVTPTTSNLLSTASVSMLSPEKASRFSQIRDKLRFSRSRKSSKSPFTDDNAAMETRSIDSTATLVDSPPYLSTPAEKDDTRYLTLLAPLVACLQRIGASVISSADHDLRVTFLKRCEELSDLLKELRKEALFSPLSQADESHDDMRLLLLTALHKKVVLEKTKCATPHPFRAPSPLSPIKELDTPFILHASSLADNRAVVPRTPSPPKPIAPLVKVSEGGFSDFMGHSQQTWRMNVHRLGSFQASALFSPSPIAVNRAMRGAVRL